MEKYLGVIFPVLLALFMAIIIAPILPENKIRTFLLKPIDFEIKNKQFSFKVFILFIIIFVGIIILSLTINKKDADIGKQSQTSTPRVTQISTPEVTQTYSSSETYTLYVNAEEIICKYQDNLNPKNTSWQHSGVGSDSKTVNYGKLSLDYDLDFINLINIETKEEYLYSTYTKYFNGYTYNDIKPSTYEVNMILADIGEWSEVLSLKKSKLNLHSEPPYCWVYVHSFENPNKEYIEFSINSIRKNNGELFYNYRFDFGIQGMSTGIYSNENGDINYTFYGLNKEYHISYEDENRNTITFYFTPEDGDELEIIFQ